MHFNSNNSSSNSNNTLHSNSNNSSNSSSSSNNTLPSPTCMAGPAMSPTLCPSEMIEVWVVRSSSVVTFDTYRRAVATMPESAEEGWLGILNGPNQYWHR